MSVFSGDAVKEMEQIQAERADMEKYRRDWRKDLKKRSYAQIRTEYDWWCAMVQKHNHRLEEDYRILEELHHRLSELHEKIASTAKAQFPIAFFKPSWEQAQILNSWHPEFEPDRAPTGYRSTLVFCANRIGKSCVMVIDTLLWLLPNDPDWPIFEEYEDHLGRGTYRVHRRPNWDYWKKTGKMEFDLSEPPKSACEIWQGCPNDEHWHDKIGKEYRRWIPPSMIGVRGGKDLAWNIAEKWFRTKWESEVRGKTYNSDILAWAGKAVWRVNLDEGIPPYLYAEALTRVQAGGYFHWAYTPAEPRNLGDRTKLAHDVAKGKPEVKPPGDVKLFKAFRMADAPEWILPEEKKKDDLARFARMGGEGKVRAEGGFFESSPVVFSNFKREWHVLPWDGLEILKRFPDACLIRGMDEGTANPTACVWVAILRSGEYVVYRDWEQANLSVTQRVEKIISLSRNTRELVKWHQEEDRKRWRENMVSERFRRTFLDSKAFRKDATSYDAQDDWTENYRKAGLAVEPASRIGPAARCDFVNDMLLPDHTRKHLCTGLGLNYPLHGFRLYFANDCTKVIERMENYLQEQVKTGARMGQFTGQPSTEDDHTIDALCLKKGTLIATERGGIPIEEVTPGTNVLTRRGWRPVTHAWMSSPSARIWHVETSDGKILKATGNHPVFVEGKGFIRVDSLEYGDRLVTCNESKPSSSTESSSAATRILPEQSISGTSLPAVSTGSGEWKRFTGKSGSIITDPSRKAVTFTIGTETGATTTYRIFSVSLHASITHFIQSGTWISRWSTSDGYAPLPLSGTDPKRVGNGTGITPEPASPKPSANSGESALTAERNSFTRNPITPESSAPGVALQPIEGNPEWTTSSAPAASAGTVLRSTATSEPEPAVPHVRRVYESIENAPVYDLTVEDAHEFFADGVLVHNCYPCVSKLRWQPPELLSQRLASVA